MSEQYSFIIKDMSKHAHHNVGQCFWITSVNRTTGEITGTYENPWPAHNKRMEAFDRDLEKRVLKNED